MTSIGQVLLSKDVQFQSSELNRQIRGGSRAASKKAGKSSIWGAIGGVVGGYVLPKLVSHILGDPTGMLLPAILKGVSTYIGSAGSSRLAAGGEDTRRYVKKRKPHEFFQESARQARADLRDVEDTIKRRRGAAALEMGLTAGIKQGIEGGDLYNVLLGKKPMDWSVGWDTGGSMYGKWRQGRSARSIAPDFIGAFG